MRLMDIASRNKLNISFETLDEVMNLYDDTYMQYVIRNPYMRIGIYADVKKSHGIEFFKRLKGFVEDCGSNLQVDCGNLDIPCSFCEKKIDENTSDGYHTFKELYHHRALLFSVIVHKYKDRAWKSLKHDDGTMYDGMFIVGVETPWGQATYHYDVDPYWDIFDCKVLEHAPKWDGHTPTDAINRIAKLVELD